MDRPHVSVLEQEFLNFFSQTQLPVFFEGTVGAGGHAAALLKAHPEIEHYIGCDVDPDALEIARQTLLPWQDKVELIQGNFSQVKTYLEKRKIKEVNGFFLT